MTFIAVVIGLLLLGMGIYALVLAKTPDVWSYVGSAVLVVLGVNMLYASFTGKRSWLSRLGPLP